MRADIEYCSRCHSIEVFGVCTVASEPVGRSGQRFEVRLDQPGEAPGVVRHHGFFALFVSYTLSSEKPNGVESLPRVRVPGALSVRGDTRNELVS